MYPNDLQAADAELARVMDGEVVTDVRYRIKTPSGKLKHIFASGAPIVDEAGDIVKLVGVNMDITRLMDLERIEAMVKELQRKNQEIAEFAYLTSHDLQEPLRTINSFAKLLADRYETALDERGLQILSFLTDASQHLSNLVRGLIDYHRLRKDREKVPVDCYMLAHEAADNLQASIEEQGALVRIDQLPQVMGFEGELRQLFQNLLSNAIKFQAKDSQPMVHISCLLYDGAYCFQVRDNGIGISPDHQQKVFRIFQRLHDRDTFDGNGIGLAFCQKIVDMHGGKIWVESSPGVGSTFFFTIPISQS